MDALLSDICISTSAAPTFLPPHYFENQGKKFNLVDGGVVANNPVTSQKNKKKKKSSRITFEFSLTQFNCVALYIWKILISDVGCHIGGDKRGVQQES